MTTKAQIQKLLDAVPDDYDIMIAVGGPKYVGVLRNTSDLSHPVVEGIWTAVTGEADELDWPGRRLVMDGQLFWVMDEGNA